MSDNVFSGSALKALKTPGKPFIHDVNQPSLKMGPAGMPCLSNAIATQWSGGARRVRTDDLMLAKHALYQLSYGPLGVWCRFASAASSRRRRQESGRPGQTRTADLTLIRRTL